MTRPEIVEPSACTWCGIAQRGHGRQYADAAGWHGWEQPSQEQMLARMKARRLQLAVAKVGALPMPVGPEPRSAETELEGARLALWEAEQRIAALEAERHVTNEALSDAAEQKRADRDRIAELEAERAKYVGKEPTIAEEMAYLSRCIDSVLDLCSAAEAKGITSGGPFTVEAVRKAADGLVERRSYPPAMPWAQLMDDEDLHEFLGDLGGAALDYYRSDPSVPDREVLASIEKACADWRLTAEAQHAHNTAPGPDAITRQIAPSQALREVPDGEHYRFVHRENRIPHDMPETGGAPC